MKSHIYIYTTMFVVMLSVVTICEAVQPTSGTTGPNGFVTTEDGVTLISQDKKTTFPIIISQPGSYRLSSNLTVPVNTNGIEIQADNVTLDLNGFQITGGGFNSGTGITDNGAGHAQITVRNGTIRDFNVGIDLQGSFQNVGQIRAISNNGTGEIVFNGIGIQVGSRSTVSGNIADANNFLGIGVGDNSIVTGNIATNNARGIIVGSNSTVTGNTASSNLGNGLTVGNNSTVSGNTASSNTNGLGASCPSNLVGNTAANNSDSDISTDGTGCTRANNNPAP